MQEAEGQGILLTMHRPSQYARMSVIFCHLVEGLRTVHKAEGENDIFDFMFWWSSAEVQHISFSHE